MQVQRSQNRVTYKKHQNGQFVVANLCRMELAMANSYEGLKLWKKKLPCLAENYQLVDMAKNYWNLLQPSCDKKSTWLCLLKALVHEYDKQFYLLFFFRGTSTENDKAMLCRPCCNNGFGLCKGNSPLKTTLQGENGLRFRYLKTLTWRFVEAIAGKANEQG